MSEPTVEDEPQPAQAEAVEAPESDKLEKGEDAEQVGVELPDNDRLDFSQPGGDGTETFAAGERD